MEQNSKDRKFISENKFQENKITQNQENLSNYPIDDSLDFSQNRKNRQRQIKKIWLFALMSGVVVLFVFFQIYKNFSDPFKIDLPDFLLSQLDNEAKSEAEIIEDLKNEDTDGDGLTDYEEIYIYGTSIFLEDSSGDGISDYEAIRMGIDPLCPQGQNCNLLRLITPQTKLAEIVQSVRLNPDLTLAQASAAEFREFLLENGMEEEELAVLTDEDLLDIFYIWQESEVLSEDDSEFEITAEAVKEFLLLQPGVDAREIESLTDEELLEIRDQLFFNN